MDESIWDFLLSHSKQEWSVIAGAPYSCGLLALAMLLLIAPTVWWIVSHFYKERIATLETHVSYHKDRATEKRDVKGVDARLETTPTSLDLQFYGDERTPTAIRSENILSWYTYWAESINVDFRTQEGNPAGAVRVPKRWFIFAIFKKPCSYQQIIVSFNSPGFPNHQVQVQHSHYTIISVGSDIPLGVLNIYAKIE